MKSLVASLMGGLILLSEGCSSSATIKAERPMDPAQEKLLLIGQAYRQFNQQRHQAPKGPADVQAILTQRGAATDAFISPRDGQPFVVCWGVDMMATPKWAKSRPLLAWEQVGQAGSRYVLTVLRNVELLSDEEFQKSSFPPGHEPRR